MEIKPKAFSPLYPWAFIIVINSLELPDNNIMLANNALYPWGTRVGKDKLGLLFVELECIILIGAQCKVQTRKECNHAASACLQITSGPASWWTSPEFKLYTVVTLWQFWWIFTAKPRHGHFVFILWLYQPTSPCPTLTFLLTQNQSPKDIARNDITNYCLQHIYIIIMPYAIST